MVASMVVMDSPDRAGMAFLSTQKPTHDSSTRDILGMNMVMM